ncbi:MAG: hypothetical protein JO353_10730, partial [Phycisphaerae bacterium]|nr:hypothetical protein [Phycisphaerae bacterium]
MAGDPEPIHSEPRSLVPQQICLLFLAGLTFLPVLNAGFLDWDDNRHLTNNPLLRLDRIGEFWSRPYFGLYVPVTYSIWTVLAVVSGAPLHAW